MSLQAKRFKRRPTAKYKARNQRKHTMRRFEQRFGRSLSKADYFSLIQKIQNGRSICIRWISNTLKNHLINFKGQQIVVGYCTTTHRVATVFPVEWLENEWRVAA